MICFMQKSSAYCEKPSISVNVRAFKEALISKMLLRNGSKIGELRSLVSFRSSLSDLSMQSISSPENLLFCQNGIYFIDSWGGFKVALCRLNRSNILWKLLIFY